MIPRSKSGICGGLGFYGLRNSRTETGPKVTSCTGKKKSQQEKTGTGAPETSVLRKGCFPPTWVVRHELLSMYWTYRVTTEYLP